MRVAITGHSAGIGQCFAQILSERGHEVVGLSRRDGNNIRSLQKIVGPIVECDWFINNAQAGYAQTELLYKVWHQWHDQRKLIWLIGSIMSAQYTVDFEMQEYKLQKQTLDQAYYNLKNTSSKCRLVLIRPGIVATQPHNTAGVDSAPVRDWCEAVVDTWEYCKKRNLRLQEISLGYGS
ncbi:MAG: hypothetical protein CMF52_01115 [Legionellales bacterium]|nr:hypothetical protein [Legionellales bacterium]|tara:strand:- start:394 stop:930 length:537 start_codon:yes stop_codon:yes gene_type:complete